MEKSRNKIIIGLLGSTGSGKDTVCQYIKDSYGSKEPVFCLKFSFFLSEALAIFTDEPRKEDQQWLSMILRERFGNNILVKAVLKRVNNIETGIIIINGIRIEEDFQMVKSIGGKVIYIDAKPEIRWSRVVKRKEKADDNVSYDKFLEIEKAKTEILIPVLGKKADIKVDNNRSFEELYLQIDKILFDLGVNK